MLNEFELSHLEQFKKNVFLCHLTQDKDFVIPVAERLRNNKVRAWIDKDDLGGGVDWENVIKREIGDTDAIIVFISPAAHVANSTNFFHKEIKLALDELKKRRKHDMYIVPVNIKDNFKEYPSLSGHHHINGNEPDWFERLLTSIGIIKGDGLEYSFERQKTVVEIEKLKIDLVDTWIKRNQFEDGSSEYRDGEQVAMNIVKQIDKRCELIGERFKPADLYRRVSFMSDIDRSTPIMAVSEPIYYGRFGALVDRKYIGNRLYVVEKGGKPSQSYPSKRIGQMEYKDTIYGYAHFYSEAGKGSPIERNKEYLLFEGQNDVHSLLVGSFKTDVFRLDEDHFPKQDYSSWKIDCVFCAFETTSPRHHCNYFNEGISLYQMREGQRAVRHNNQCVGFTLLESMESSFKERNNQRNWSGAKSPIELNG